MPSRRAFTAIELVVTIGVIGVVTAVIVSTLASARESASRAVCMSQLRQMTTALRLYADDHDAMPISSSIIGARKGTPAGGPVSLVRFELPRAIADYLDADAPTATVDDDGLLRIDSAAPWICPSERRAAATGLDTNASGHPHRIDGFSYGYSLAGFGLGDRSLTGRYRLNADPAAGRASLRYLEQNPTLSLLYDDQPFHADEPGLAEGAEGRNFARFDGSVGTD